MISANSRHIPAFTVVGKNLAALCSTCFSVFFSTTIKIFPNGHFVRSA